MYIPLLKVFMSPEAISGATEVLSSGYVGQGKKVDEFETKLKDFLNCDNLLALNSCTTALELALRLVANQGDEVLTTPLTCWATTAAILNRGLRPKWVDVDLKTGNMDLTDLENKLNHSTRVVMVVHFAGHPVDLDTLDEILRNHEAKYGRKPVVIEDCAHAFGSMYKDRFIGTHGNICCFSFQAVKLLTCVDGGAIVVPPALYERAKLLRWYGMDRNRSRNRQNVAECGGKYHMNDLNAAIGIGNLKYMHSLLWKQMRNYAFYQDKLSENDRGFDDITLGKPQKNMQPNGWMFPVRIEVGKKKYQETKKEFVELLKDHNIDVDQPHVRNDKHDCVSEYRCALPNMDILEKELTCIPCGWWLSEEDTDYVKNVIRWGILT